MTLSAMAECTSRKRSASPDVFSSFWMAGFESACHMNQAGRRIDMVAATFHDRLVDEDYGRLPGVGITTIRETVRWHLSERGGAFDFEGLVPMVRAARAHRLQVVWTLCHYGWPDDVDLLTPAFVDRFERFCFETARYLREQSDDVPMYTPINEMSFLSWAAGEMGLFSPCQISRGAEVKRQLVRACIAGIEAIRRVDARARIVTSEPLIHVIAERGDVAARDAAESYRTSQFQACDMLTGTLEPALGGRPEYVDVVGVNFYHDNQWEHPGGQKLMWHIEPRDRRWTPLHRLLQEVHARYQRPVCITETSHVGSGRARWIREIGTEVSLALASGVPIVGICLYPIIDRCGWDDPDHWHHSGLWDVLSTAQDPLRRVLNWQYASELTRVQAQVAQVRGKEQSKP